ncbi:MAG: glutamine-synthetase adenylyltransferase, partial [Xanthomonadales bacterium]|nr:glutamine-synthetase adenylyltransferase [Xanthomonadales bacterium]
GLLGANVITEIRHDYTFLRLLENRIQALRDQQTHRVPQAEDRDRIARAMCEKDVASLEKSMTRTRNRVSERFSGIFPSHPRPPADQKWSELWRGHQINRQEIEDPDGASPHHPLTLFVQRLGRVALSHRAHDRLDRFMPGLLERLDQQSLGPETLNRVFDLVLSICRRSPYLVLLEQNPKALERMLDLFDRSEWIASLVIRFPALLDELIDPALGRQLPDQANLSASVERILEAAQGTETLLESLNYLKLATELRIAVSQLKGNLDAVTAQENLSSLASAILGGVLVLARREVEARHGTFTGNGRSAVEPGDMAIIGYGSLGAGELGYDSDLDIVFLFEAGAEMSGGARPLTPERYYARLAQRMLSFLTVMTPAGRLYEVDTRLRPNGRAGSLVSSMAAFREYQLNEAWTWELQALTRARFIAGSRTLAAAFNRVRQEVLCRQRTEAELAVDLLEMRRKMSREHDSRKSPDDRPIPKHQPGGLIDIEFVTQLGVLSSARLFPRVLQVTGTLKQLNELKSIGWLSCEEARILRETAGRLSQQRMMASLVQEESSVPEDTESSAEIFARKMGESSPSLP